MERAGIDAAPLPEPSVDENRPAAILRGSARGLEIVVDGHAAVEAIAAAVIGRLEAAPAFFRGTDVRIRVEDGPLPAGCLARLDEIASRFELRIVEVGAVRPRGDSQAVAIPLPAPEPPLATAELAPAAPDALAVQGPEPASPPEPEIVTRPEPEPEAEPAGTRVVVGPVRSGIILEHLSHIVIFGDVNPGAEVRASGSIVVMGRLRGTAHAGIGRDAGFILALRLEPQQLRIGQVVARADDSETPGSRPEIAHVAAGRIIVEEYRGKLPRELAASLQEELHG